MKIQYCQKRFILTHNVSITKSSPNLCVKFFRQCYVAGDALHPLGYMDALREETVKGAQHLGEVPLTVSERSAIRR